ncbi:MAG: PEP/pyruvate-binding domain-containing protein [Eubacteriales bacterium]|nr:PEP/pyruvate-binding domain-containing protein [Eubacteriales bacterium]
MRIYTDADRVSTGNKGIDDVIDMLRMGDNVVWQVDAVSDYRRVVAPYLRQARKDGRDIYYMRFGAHEPVIEDTEGVTVCRIHAELGFEHFAMKVHHVIREAGVDAFYIFDCLTDLVKYWYSDLMIGNFFRVTCPYLFELNTIAYFALIRDSHTEQTISRIRETTQLLLDLYNVGGNDYLHPLKVWQRKSETMFLPHLIAGETAKTISSSSEAAALFSHFSLDRDRTDYWDVVFREASMKLSGSAGEQEEAKELLLKLIVGEDNSISELCRRYLTLRDLLNIKSRELGTGRIGGKAVGMFLARKILESDREYNFSGILEVHDSFYMGADVFYTYIVHNDCWRLRTLQKSREGYYQYAKPLREKILQGSFPEYLAEKFKSMLEHFGQSPIIVRSSSLQEDNFGNAFAGKYDSVFCVNQGTLEERYAAFEAAVKQVYASTMNDDALNYRMNRGLWDKDEQMALLIQRVSGDYYGKYFFPHIAGVGNSSNLYVWDSSIDMDAGMMRLVFGLGTRAVDRIEGDYPRIVCLDDPGRPPLISYGDEKKFSQHYVDLLDTSSNEWTHRDVDEILAMDIRTDKNLFSSLDFDTMRRLQEMGRRARNLYILNFNKLLKQTGFPEDVRRILKRLSEAYDYPVDIEFAANFDREGNYKINLLQCRPLQTRGLGKTVEIPGITDESRCFFATHGNFMGGNIHIPVDYVILVKAKPYLLLSEQERYGVARTIGKLNQALRGKNAMLVGPGRWGTSTTSLGVPVHFTELCHMSAICEVAHQEGNLMPELSYGSHFFQDLVESGVFYAAIFEKDEDVFYREAYVEEHPNDILQFVSTDYTEVIHVARTAGLELYSDTVSQRLVCLEKER